MLKFKLVTPNDDVYGDWHLVRLGDVFILPDNRVALVIETDSDWRLLDPSTLDTWCGNLSWSIGHGLSIGDVKQAFREWHSFVGIRYVPVEKVTLTLITA